MIRTPHAGLTGLATLLLALAAAQLPAAAHEDTPAGGAAPLRADGHAPIGVMGDHMHKAGEAMLSYRYMRMDMSGARSGTRDLSNADILATPNPFFGRPMQPPGLRVIPTEMTMEMHMVGAMWAPTDNTTLMVMGSYLEKEMDHIVFNAPGTAQIGGFTTRTSGIGDIKVSGLFRAYRYANAAVHLNAGVSLPTGSIDETGRVLTPMGTTPVLRLPYPMQLGSGTVDLLPGITYTDRVGDVSWGAQATGIYRIGENGEGYSLGDRAKGTVWAAYQFAPWVSSSLRISAESTGRIDGQDPRIVAPVHTADPANHGGDIVEAALGLNLVGQDGAIRGHRVAIEATLPVHQRLNGPQMKRDWGLTVGWQYAF